MVMLNATIRHLAIMLYTLFSNKSKIKCREKRAQSVDFKIVAAVVL